METMIAVLSVNVDGTFTVLSTCPISPTEQLLGLLDDFILLGDNRTSENDGNVSIKHWTLHYEILLGKRWWFVEVRSCMHALRADRQGRGLRIFHASRARGV